MSLTRSACLLAFVLCLWGCTDPMAGRHALTPETHHAMAFVATARTNAVLGGYGTFANPPRDAAQVKDLPKLVDELVELRVNTYHYLIYHDKTDWDDFKTFLAMVRGKGIAVWVSVMPPSHFPPHTHTYSEPYRADYEEWARQIARLSLAEPHLVAWSIDDFTTNLDFFTPAVVRRMRQAAGEVNPRLAFVPCCYYREVTRRPFAAEYAGLIDGILFPYRAESTGRGNVMDASRADAEIRHLKSILGPNVPVILDVYSSTVDRVDPPLPFVREVIAAGFRSADGVQIFRHPNRGTRNWEIIQDAFARRSAQHGGTETRRRGDL